MADYRIVTPTRIPGAGEVSGNGVIFESGNYKISYGASDIANGNQFTIQAGSADDVYVYLPNDCLPIHGSYPILKGWREESVNNPIIDPPEIIIPASIVEAATPKTSFFDVMAFEEGTTACKLAYLNETKGLFRQAIDEAGQAIADSDTFRSYVGKMKNVLADANVSSTIDFSVDTEIMSDYDFTVYYPDLSGQTINISTLNAMQGTGIFTFTAPVWFALVVPVSFDITVHDDGGDYVTFNGNTITMLQGVIRVDDKQGDYAVYLFDLRIWKTCNGGLVDQIYID